MPPSSRYLVVLAFFLLGLSSMSCDLFGGDDDPAWVGNWRETSEVGGPGPGGGNTGPYYSITEGQFERVVAVAFGCVIQTFDVVNTNGDTLEVIPENSAGEARQNIEFETSGNTLTIDFLPTVEEDSTVTAEPLEDAPRDAADCESSS